MRHCRDSYDSLKENTGLSVIVCVSNVCLEVFFVPHFEESVAPGRFLDSLTIRKDFRLSLVKQFCELLSVERNSLFCQVSFLSNVYK